MLLWLWRRLVTTAPIRPIAWEPLCATSAGLERQKKKKKPQNGLNVKLDTIKLEESIDRTIL